MSMTLTLWIITTSPRPSRFHHWPQHSLRNPVSVVLHQKTEDCVSIIKRRRDSSQILGRLGSNNADVPYSSLLFNQGIRRITNACVNIYDRHSLSVCPLLLVSFEFACLRALPGIWRNSIVLTPDVVRPALRCYKRLNQLQDIAFA